MKSLLSKILLFVFVVSLIGCAASYKPINPQSISYNSHDVQDGVSISYKYDVLAEKGNRKYANKEEKKNVKLIAVKITNNTDSIINIGRDAIFYSGHTPLVPMDPSAVKQTIQQIVPAYLPYALLTFLTLNVTSGSSSEGYSTESYPIGLAIGPTITIGNMALAGASNKKLYEELTVYNLLNKDIKSGETVYGIIGLKDTGYVPITVKIKN
jgi:hypothetical protein